MRNYQNFVHSNGGVVFFDLRPFWVSFGNVCSVIEEYGVSYA